MSEIKPDPGTGHDIELVFRVSGVLNQANSDLRRLASCAERLKELAENILTEEFGRSPVFISAALGLVSGRPPRKSARRASPGSGPTKKDLVLQLLKQDGGATMTDLQTATGWRRNTVSAQLTYLSKLGHNIQRDSLNGDLRYQLQA